jgi:hypothetical protein
MLTGFELVARITGGARILWVHRQIRAAGCGNDFVDRVRVAFANPLIPDLALVAVAALNLFGEHFPRPLRRHLA